MPGATGDPAYGVASKAYSINYIRALYDKPGIWKHLRNFTADVAAFGESVTVPSFPRLTATTINSTTGAFSYDNTSIAAELVTMNLWKAVAFSVPDMVFYQAKLDVRQAFPAAAIDALNNELELEVGKLALSLSTNTAGVNGSDLTDTVIQQAIGKLVDYHVPLNNLNDLCWVLPSSQFAPVRSLKAYTANFRINAGSPDSEGGGDIQAAIDTLYGIPVYFRNDSWMAVSGGHVGGLFYRDCIGVGIQKAPSLRPPVYIPGTGNMELATTTLFGCAIVKDEVGVQVLCK